MLAEIGTGAKQCDEGLSLTEFKENTIQKLPTTRVTQKRIDELAVA